MSQYWTCDRLSELQSNQAEQARRRDELIHQLEVAQRERDHTAETERIRLQSKLADMSEELHQKLLQKEMKLREDSQKKLADLEKVCVLMKKIFQILSLSRMVQMYWIFHICNRMPINTNKIRIISVVWYIFLINYLTRKLGKC